jgi:hypothetical protein
VCTRHLCRVKGLKTSRAPRSLHRGTTFGLFAVSKQSTVLPAPRLAMREGDGSILPEDAEWVLYSQQLQWILLHIKIIHVK